MDILFIRGLEAHAIIGVAHWERQVRQRVILDLELATDVRAAAATDRIEQALDYARLSARLTAFIEASRFQLIETLAEAVAGLLLDEFGIAWVRLGLRKPGALGGTVEAGVVIERRRMAP